MPDKLQELLSSFFLKDFIYLFLDRGDGREREGEKHHQCVVASRGTSTGDLTYIPGVCPDWESNQ